VVLSVVLSYSIAVDVLFLWDFCFSSWVYMCVWPVSWCVLSFLVVFFGRFVLLCVCFSIFQMESGSRTQFLSVFGVPSQRPELRAASVGTMDHDYVRAASKKISILVSKLGLFTLYCGFVLKRPEMHSL
jgi:hypothetical protein